MLSVLSSGSVGIGIVNPSRKLHVEGSEIHSGDGGAGFSFGNRETASFVENPTAGERWVCTLYQVRHACGQAMTSFPSQQVVV